jgi:hypothetical protein
MLWLYARSASMEAYIGIISVLGLFFVAPLIVFSFIYFSKRDKVKLDELRIKKEMLELEVEKERVKVELLEAENLKYDRIIDESGKR